MMKDGEKIRDFDQTKDGDTIRNCVKIIKQDKIKDRNKIKY